MRAPPRCTFTAREVKRQKNEGIPAMSNSETTMAPGTIRSRREFLRKGVVTAIAAPMAVSALASCTEGTAQKTATASDSDHSGGSTAPHPTTPAAAAVDPRTRADQMDAKIGRAHV